MVTVTPLRYPGSKNKIRGYLQHLVEVNGTKTYIEPYVGGGSVAMWLLLEGVVDKVVINDFDRSVYAFWHSVFFNTDVLVDKIRRTSITIDEWHKQRKILTKGTEDLVDLGFAMLFCNRTNRSGILTAGVIGGLEQKGTYKLDCRFNKEKLIKMIEELSLYKGRVEVHNKDAVELLTSGEYDLKDALIFLDPPYFDKGRRLYVKSYTTDCHVGLAKVLKGSLQGAKWVLTYDKVPDIARLYAGVDSLDFCLHYSANKRVVGTEVMYFSKNLVKGKYEDYLKLASK